MIEVYKILHEFYDPLTTCSLLTPVSDSVPTRQNNPFKLFKPRTNTTQYQMFFTNRIINPWNHLPYDIVVAKTIDSFKFLFDKYFEDIMFTIDFKILCKCVEPSSEVCYNRKCILKPQ